MKNMQRVPKLVFLSLGIVFLAAACGNTGQPLDNQESQNQQQQDQPLQQENTQAPTSSAATPTGKLAVGQTVQGSNFNQPGPLEVQEGQTAMGLLKATHQVQTKNYSGVGEFVASIDGMEPKSSEFWAFYVNGAQSPVGASAYKLKNNDQISWRLEKIEAYK